MKKWKPGKLFASCVDIVKLLPEGSLKVVVSWRINSPRDYPEIDRSFSSHLFDAAVECRSELNENPLRAKAAVLKPLDKMEIAGAWEKYSKDKRKRFSTRFTLEELELRDRDFTKQLSNPLLLRLFLELNRGKGLFPKAVLYR